MPEPKQFLTDEEMEALSASSAPPEFIPDEAPPATVPSAAPSMAGFLDIPPSQAPPRALRPTSAGESLLRGATSYGTFNFGDEIVAGLGAGAYGVAKGIRSLLPGGVPEGALSVAEVRQRMLENERTGNESAAAAHPLYYHGAGLATTAALVPGVGQVKGLSAANRIAALAASGGLTGGLAGAGSSEGSLVDRLRSARTGALIGAAAAPLADAGVRALGALSGTAAEGFRRAAGYAAARIAGGIQRDVGKVGGARAFSEAGNEAVERGLVRPWDFAWGAGVRQEQRIADFASRATDEITQALDQAGARAPVAPIKQALLNASDELRQFADANPGNLSKVDGIIASLEKQADASGTVSARTLQTAKKVIDDFTKTWDPFAKSSLAQNLNKAMYGAIAEAQEQAVETASNATGRTAYEAAKKASALARKLEVFGDSVERREANALAAAGGLPGTLGTLGGVQHGLSTGDLFGGAASAIGGNIAMRLITSPRTATIGLRGAQRLAELAPHYADSPLNPLIARSAAQAIVQSVHERR